MKENCLQCLQQKKQNSAWKLKDGEQWKVQNGVSS